MTEQLLKLIQQLKQRVEVRHKQIDKAMAYTDRTLKLLDAKQHQTPPDES